MLIISHELLPCHVLGITIAENASEDNGFNSKIISKTGNASPVFNTNVSEYCILNQTTTEIGGKYYIVDANALQYSYYVTGEPDNLPLPDGISVTNGNADKIAKGDTITFEDAAAQQR